MKKILATILCTVAAGSALANTQATIENHSKTQNTISVTYRIFHQNPGHERVLEEKTHTTTINNSYTIPLSLDGYKQVGIMTVAVDNHTLPTHISYLCSVKTSERKPDGVLSLSFKPNVGQQSELTCSSQKGETEK